MGLITELSEEDLSRYIDTTFANDPEYEIVKRDRDLAKRYSGAVGSCRTRAQKAVKQLEKADACIRNGEYGTAYSICHSTAGALDRLSDVLDHMPARYGETSRNGEKLATAREAVFEYLDNGILHIILPELLPRRLKYDGSKGQYENTHEQALFKSRYKDTFYREYREGKIRIGSGKVFLFTLHIYRKGDPVYDNDNLDGKAFQDLIMGSLLLMDDGPGSCGNIYDSRMGDYTHTEAYVIPEAMLIPFLTEFYGAGDKNSC